MIFDFNEILLPKLMTTVFFKSCIQMILTKYALFGSNNVTHGRVKIILYFKKDEAWFQWLGILP
jgi:hypothetical protein